MPDVLHTKVGKIQILFVYSNVYFNVMQIFSNVSNENNNGIFIRVEGI